MACLFNGGGVITLVTLVSPYRDDRDEARKRHEEQGLKSRARQRDTRSARAPPDKLSAAVARARAGSSRSS